MKSIQLLGLERMVTQVSDCFRPVLDIRGSVYEIHANAWFGENGERLSRY